MGYKALAAGLAALFVTGTAQAQMVKAQNPDSVAAALRSRGQVVEMATDGTGDPMIKTVVGGTKTTVLFYNCTNHKECATVQLYAGWHMDKPTPLDRINAWNSTKRFGRAYIDKDNDPVLEMDVDLDDGGMSQALFVDNMEFWETIVREFAQHIGFKS
jgi:hypothetical protein